MNSISQTTVSWPDVIGIALIIPMTISLMASVRVYRGCFFTAAGMMTKLSLRGPRGQIVLPLSIVALANAWQLPFIIEWMPPLPRSVAFAFGLGGLSYICLPPSVLVLAASGRGGADFAAALEFFCAPLRIAHLLDWLKAGTFARDAAGHSSYRMDQSDDSWQQAVHALAGVVPVIVMDCRAVTMHVITEIQYILAANMEHKTLFVCDEQHNAVALFCFEHRKGALVHLATAQDINTSLSECAWQYAWSGAVPLLDALFIRLKSKHRLCEQWLVAGPPENDPRGTTAMIPPFSECPCYCCSAPIFNVNWQHKVSRDQFFDAQANYSSKPIVCCLDCGGVFCHECYVSSKGSCPDCQSYRFERGVAVM